MRTSSFAIGFLSLLLAACSATTTTNTTNFDFEKSGTLIRNAAGLTPGVWYLEYEEAGSPALTMRLSFDENTLCIRGEQRAACERSVFENNLEVDIRGMRENDGVMVREMNIQP